MGVSRDCPNFLFTPIISGKATTSNFAETFTGSIGTKAHENVGNSSRGRLGVVRESRKFSGHPCIGRIGRSSLRQHSFLVRPSEGIQQLPQPLHVGRG